MPTKVLFGPGKLNELHTEQLPGKKALIVTTSGQSVIKYGYLDRVKQELDLAGVAYAVLAGIRPNPTDINVIELFPYDIFITFSAFSCSDLMDSAKLLIYVLGNDIPPKYNTVSVFPYPM